MMELGIILYRTFFFYFFVLISYRIMGKREIGQLGVIDLIVSILIAELVAISIENTNQSIFNTIIPLLLLVIMEVIFGYISIKSRRFRLLFDGKPSLIICNGKINYREMIKQRYSLDDLLLELRQKGINNIEMVEYAFLEPNGKLSIFKYNLFNFSNEYPMPLIIDGKIEMETLKHIHKTMDWLNDVLIEKNLHLDNIFYAFYKSKKVYVVKKSNIK